jgi:hypothetical protein
MDLSDDGSGKKRGLGAFLARTAGVVLGLFILYVLGIGPLSYYGFKHFIMRGETPPRAVALIYGIYGPLEEAVMFTPLQEPLQSYKNWWMGFAIDEMAHNRQ